MTKPNTITFKVWLEIERFDEATGRGETLDAPGSHLAAFATYDEAREYAERISRFADDINP